MAIINFDNLYLGLSTDTKPTDITVTTNAIFIEIDTGILYKYDGTTWNRLIHVTKTDQLFASITRQVSITNIGTSYVDIFSSFYDGLPIPIDTTGYTKLGIVLLWNKNGGSGRHDVRLVNASNTTEVFVSTEAMPSGIPSGRTKNYDIAIPNEFVDFRGELLIQAKSSSPNDDPIFDGLLIYLIR